MKLKLSIIIIQIFNKNLWIFNHILKDVLAIHNRLHTNKIGLVLG